MPTPPSPRRLASGALALCAAAALGAQAPFDLLITEVMPDPTPAAGLPEVEYVELHNPSDAPLPLGAFALARGDDEPFALPDTLLGPGGYLALTADATGDPRFAAAPGLPALTNAGARLRLFAADGAVVDEVDYRPSWHRAGLRDGGYALERVDLARPCHLGAANWTSSTSLAGGTPGAANAAAGELPADSLRVTAVRPLGAGGLLLETNRVLDAASEASLALVDAAGAERRPLSVGRTPGALASIDVRLADPLATGGYGRVALSPRASSCAADERVSRESVAYGVPAAPTPGDWAVNEMMYDPLAGDGRYVELVNVGTSLLSTGGVRLARLADDGAVAAVAAVEGELLVAPGGFVVLAADPPALLARFPGARPAAVAAADLPALGDAECLLLFDAAAELALEEVCYDARWHNRAYANTDGVSLERIAVELPGADASNWTSAAVAAGGGTPTRANSQASPPVDPAGLPEGAFALAAERLSPDGDGYEDVLAVRFRFAEAGTLVTFTVLDLRGRAVYTSEEDVSAGRAGAWTWDGVDDDGAVVPVGTYVLRASAFGAGRRERVEYLGFSVVGRL